MNTVDNQLPFVSRASNTSEIYKDYGKVNRDFTENKLNGIDLRGTDLSDVVLARDQLIDVCLTQSDLSWSFSRDTNWEGFDFSNANFSLATLRGVNLRGANLCLAILRGTDLRDANLQEAILSGSILRNADLREANLSNAYLLGSNLSHAALSNANLSNAHLLGANLDHTDLCGTEVNNARFGWNTGISKSMKFELQLRGAVFED
ncbi:MAG: pentapeptide repeat-containing protein [Cyanobacteria bacterium P01_D01_bin.50]